MLDPTKLLGRPLVSVLDIAVLNWILAAIGIGSAVVAVWFYFRPGMRRASAVADAILGEAEETDRSGNLVAPARPGLVHRVATVEDAVKTLAEAVAAQTALNDRVSRMETQVLANTENIATIMAATAERIVTKAEAAAMWQAVANRDDLNGFAEEPGGEVDGRSDT